VESNKLRFGPNTPKVNELLNWLDRRELLCFGKPLSGPFILVPDFDEAKAIAQGSDGNSVDWAGARENAEASLYNVGLLDTPSWLPYKPGIEELLFLVGDKVAAILPEAWPGILDDVIGDLHACALCLAVHGRLDPFHERLWNAYACGGWPCGCTGKEPEAPDYELNLEGRAFYVFWRDTV
jgi:hypothetical protein